MPKGGQQQQQQRLRAPWHKSYSNINGKQRQDQDHHDEQEDGEWAIFDE